MEPVHPLVLCLEQSPSSPSSHGGPLLTAQVSAPGRPLEQLPCTPPGALCFATLFSSRCTSTASESTARWAGKYQKPAKWKRLREPMKWFSMGMARARVSGKLWKSHPSSPATFQFTLLCGCRRAWGWEREEEARGASPLGSFSASLLLLGLILRCCYRVCLPTLTTARLFSLLKLGTSGRTLRIFGKVPPGHPVFRKISQKDLSIAVKCASEHLSPNRVS